MDQWSPAQNLDFVLASFLWHKDNVKLAAESVISGDTVFRIPSFSRLVVSHCFCRDEGVGIESLPSMPYPTLKESEQFNIQKFKLKIIALVHCFGPNQQE